MDDSGGLLQSFTRLSNDIVAERDRRAAEGARNLDIAFDLLAMIVRHYHEEYCTPEHLESCLKNTLGAYPWADHASPVAIEVIREWILQRCDRDLESVPYSVIDALRGEYLTLLWRALRDRHIVPTPKDGDNDSEKTRSMLVGLGFNEPYRPRWGFSYICEQLETARNALSHVNPALVDARMMESIRDNTILVLKSYKRFIQMSLSFYGQYAFDTPQQLVAALKPDVARPDKYLKTCGLTGLVDLLSQLEEYAQERAKNEQFWREFVDVIIMNRDLIAQLRRVCEEALGHFKLNNRAAYTVEEALGIREQIVYNMSEHLLNLRDHYRAAFPVVIALKRCTYFEDGRTRIDFLDEVGKQGVTREDIDFQARCDFYFMPRPEKSPIILPVEDWHQDFIMRDIHDDFLVNRQLDDKDLLTLFHKFEKCRQALNLAGTQHSELVVPTTSASPLADLGISQDGRIFDEALLEQAIIRALREGETDMIEFKAGPSDDEMIATEMAALANTKGGILVFGLPDDPQLNSRDWDKAVTGRVKLAEREFRNSFIARLDKVAKGPPAQASYCSPPINWFPIYRPAERYLSQAKNDVIIVAVLPCRDDLCEVTGSGIWVRLRGSREKAKPEWLKTYRDSGKKLWVQ